jgi:hypothetical protein
MSKYVTMGKAIDWLLTENPVRRQCWDEGTYLIRVGNVLQMWTDGDWWHLEQFCVGSEDMLINDWELGTVDAYTRELVWEEDK